MPKIFGLLRRRRGALASGAALTAATVALSTLAVLYQGVPTADLKLDDGGVWVTKTNDLLVGHLNHPSRLLDGALRTTAADYDVLQDGDRVAVFDRANNVLSPIDPGTTELTGQQSLPKGSRVVLGGDKLGVLGGGRLYALDADHVIGARIDKKDALATVGDGGAVAISQDGTALFAASTAKKKLISVDTASMQVRSDTLDGIAADAQLQIAAVGAVPVIFDGRNGVLRANGRSITIPKASGARLQQTSADGDAAYLTTRTALIRQPLDGSPAQTFRAGSTNPTGGGGGRGGTPTSPVWLNGCAYAVWGDGAYLRRCEGQADFRLTLDMPDQATPVLRVNRRVVVVNDTRGGTVWVVSTKAERVENWDDVVPPPDPLKEEQESEEQQPQFELPKRSPENQKPTAVDDTYGVRPGRTAVLRVTENDSDPDGDLLAASLVGEAPGGMTVAPALGGASLQVSVPAAASGTQSFRYRIDDGRGGTDEATVTLNVRALSDNEPPVLERPQTLQVEAGATITYAALEGWKDPDGDDLFLQHAEVTGGDVVTSRSNGVIEYHAASGATGMKDVQLTVSDGRDTTTGVLRVDVRPRGSLAPIANADRYTATTGVPITLAPMQNDISRNGEQLRLARNDFEPGARITPDYAAGTLSFVADAPKIYYVQYLVTAGTQSAVGIIRIDVSDGGDNGHPPVAVRDTALLPTGRNVLVDVLANDEDPSGGVLVVQSVQVPAGSPVSAEVLEHSVVRVTDTGGLSAPVTIRYTISNGLQSAEGEVLVVPVPLPATLRAPVAVADSAIVRAGDVVSVDVLKNDYHPDNDQIQLLPDLVETKIGDGVAFVDGSRVRFQAGSKAGPAYITYEIVDSQGNKVAGYLTVQVLAADASTNSAPLAKPIIARAIAGTTVRIPVPLDGIDPDGDSVELVGTTSSPSLGRVAPGDAWLTYTAYDTAQGRDTFTYLVRDRLGATAESTVTVGVAPPSADNQAPYAVKDVVSVRPGRVVAVPVMANDSDPDGDEIALRKGGLTAPKGLNAKVEGGRVVATAPKDPGQTTLTYTIADTYGATAQAPLLLDVSADAPLRAPIARDDRVPRSAATGTGTVKVTVLENDEDPDGTTQALTVQTFSPNAKVRSGGIVEVTLTPDPQVLRYEVTDQDGLTGQAFIFAPGTKAAVPMLADVKPIVVKSGESITIALADYVTVREGKKPRVSVADSVRAGHADGSPLIKDAEHLQYTSGKGYYGPDGLGVRVTDGTGPDDPEGLSAYVTIPIQVLPIENQSPTVRNAAVSLAPGDAGVKLDLKRLTRDPDEGDLARMSYGIEGDVPSGIDASISGSTLALKASSDVKPGATLSLKVRADDGKSKPGQGAVTVSVITSQRPMPVANDDAVPDAKQGAASVVDVLANDFNPYQGDKPLTVVSTHVDTPGTHTATVQGDKVSVTPASDFFGTLVVTYRIADATNAPERQAEAKILLTVRGKPSAPGVPTVTSIQDRTVVLSWTPPPNNGSPITGYEVTSQNGYAKQCAATTCTLDGLTNDVKYTFQVVAVNAIGKSDPSPMSAEARPDARPDPPGAPTLTFVPNQGSAGSGSLDVKWDPAASHGSPVTGYDLQISGGGQLFVTGTSTTLHNLTDGQPYRVQIRAHNSAPDPSDWSPWSNPESPATVPGVPSPPTFTPASPVGGQAQINVLWSAPADGGDPSMTYKVTVKSSGAVVSESEPTTATMWTTTLGLRDDYTFSVTATNKAGSTSSADSRDHLQIADAPGKPQNVQLKNPGDHSATLSFGPVTDSDLNGSRRDQITYRYRLSGTSNDVPVQPGDTVINGLANGTSYTVDVWAETSAERVTSPVQKVGSGPQTPFGKPIVTMGPVTNADSSVTFTWTVQANGRPISAVSAPDGNNTAEGTHSYTQGGMAPDTPASIYVSYTNAGGTGEGRADGRTNPPPRPSGTVSKGPAASVAGCNGCNYVNLTTQNLSAGRYTVECWTNNGGEGSWYRGPMRLEPGTTQLTPCWYGYPNTQVWVVVVGQLETPRFNWQ